MLGKISRNRERKQPINTILGNLAEENVYKFEAMIRLVKIENVG